jgi:nucleolar protein 6
VPAESRTFLFAVNFFVLHFNPLAKPLQITPDIEIAMSADAAPQKVRTTKEPKEKKSKKSKVQETEPALDADHKNEIDATTVTKEEKRKTKKRKREREQTETMNEGEPEVAEKKIKKSKKSKNPKGEPSVDTVEDATLEVIETQDADKVAKREKKQKKDKKDREDKSSKKRKREASNFAVPETDTVEEQTNEPVEGPTDTSMTEVDNHMDEVLPQSSEEPSKKSKNNRNRKSRREKLGVEAKKEADTVANGDDVKAPEAIEDSGANGTTEPNPNSRFIVFIGNLPFSATTESISEHFKKIQPASVRHISDKVSKKSKGYAFLEFNNYDRMKSCLKLYHHSKFDDGKSPARKINVELT